MALTDNLLRYYKCDDNAASTVVLDATGTGNGTANTNTSNLYDASGKINSAFDFNSEYFDTNINVNANTNVYTFSSWVNADTLSTPKIFSSDTSNTPLRGFQLYLGASGDVNCYTGIANFATATGLVSTGSFYHVVWVLNGANSKIYVNGSNVLDFSASFNNMHF